MTDQPTNAPLTKEVNHERLLAEYREMIIKLEADGSPEERGALWDVLDTMLADMKRRQPHLQPTETSTR